MSTLGLLTYTEAAGGSYRAYPIEEVNLDSARTMVWDNFPSNVEYDVNDAVWFYRNQAEYDRDEDNRNQNLGVVAIWRAMTPSDINEDEVAEYCEMLREMGDPLSEEISDAVQRDFSEAQQLVLAYKMKQSQDAS